MAVKDICWYFGAVGSTDYWTSLICAPRHWWCLQGVSHIDQFAFHTRESLC